MIQAVSIRSEQNRFPIRSPRRWPIVSVIQGKASKRSQLFSLRQHLRQVNVSLKVTAEQNQTLSIARYADVSDGGFIIGNAGARPSRPVCVRIQANPPKIKVCIVGWSLLQCIDQASGLRPSNGITESKIRQDRLAASCRRIENVDSR